MIAYIAAYKDHTDANIVFTTLLERGVTFDRIGILFEENLESVPKGFQALTGQDPDVDVAEGAGAGAMIGGMTGLTLGALSLAIPGVGPVLALGAVAGTIAGSVMGASIGGVVGHMNRDEPIHSELEAICGILKEGGVVLLVHATEDEKLMVQTTFARRQPDAFTVRHVEPGERVTIGEEGEVQLSRPRGASHNHPRARTAAGNAASSIAHRVGSPIQRKRERDATIS